MESNKRSFIKAITFRIIGSFDTFFVSWLVTGSTNIASLLMFIEFFTKIFWYWIHERVWLKNDWGMSK